MIYFNTSKFKNLAKYLNIEKIDENNLDEIIEKFFIIPYRHTDCTATTVCFCGRYIKNYYYLINKTNNEVLIAGAGCKKTFEITRRFNDKKFNEYLKSTFDKGVFVKIDEWNPYLEDCINQYLLDIDNKTEFDKLLKTYSSNQFISETIKKARNHYNKKNNTFNKKIFTIVF